MRRCVSLSESSLFMVDGLLAVPWHSVDATNWEVGPGKFGRWKAFGGAHLGIRGSHHDLRIEVAHYTEIERLTMTRTLT